MYICGELVHCNMQHRMGDGSNIAVSCQRWSYALPVGVLTMDIDLPYMKGGGQDLNLSYFLRG